jgi:hypothetical protein
MEEKILKRITQLKNYKIATEKELTYCIDASMRITALQELAETIARLDELERLFQ